jgi:hypothetical protein
MLLNLARKLYQTIIFLSFFTIVACGGTEEQDEGDPPPQANNPPVLSGNYLTSLKVDDIYDYTPVASDSDGDTLTFTIQNKPSWADFESDTGRLYGVAREQDVGEHTDIQISVGDGEAEDSLETFSIMVKRHNQAPTISGSFPSSINEGEMYDYSPIASDADGDTLSFDIQNKPNWASFESNTGRLFGNVARQNVGHYNNIQISVSDGHAITALDNFSIEVKQVNQAPVISGDFPTAVNEDETYDYTPVAADGDGDTLVFSIQNKPVWANFDTSTGRLFGAVSAQNIGQYVNIQISVSDGQVSTALNHFSIEVMDVNHIPTISGNFPTSINEDEIYNYTPTASDSDGDALIFSIQNKPNWATFETATGRLYGEVNPENVGVYNNIQISVSDGQMITSLNSFSIEVNSVNHAPAVFGDYPTSIDQDQNYDYTPSATDSDGDSLTFSIQNKPAWATFETATGQLSGTVSDSDVGLYSNIQVTVTDGLLSDTLEFSITVNAVNQPPQISSNYPASIDAGELYDFTPVSSDDDGDQLSFTVNNKPDWADFDESSGRIFGVTTDTDVGDYSDIQVTVSDGQESSTTESFVITVVAINHPPVIENQNLNVEVTAELTITLGGIEDSDGDLLSYQVVGTSNTQLGLQSNQIIYSNDVAETEEFTVIVSDGENITEATITVIVSAIDQVLYYISPTGNDNNNGLSASTPWLSFEHAFNSQNGGMSGGDELVLLSGEYSIANGTGILRDADDYGNSLDNSASIPSGLSRQLMTTIRAAVDGGAIILGSDNLKPISIGRSFRKDRFIKVSGIKFEGGGSMYNSEYVIFKNSGFHGSLSIGTNDHSNGNSNNLIEDVWVWAKNRRLLASNYKAHNNVWRRVVIRGEGCDNAGCESAPKADPSVGLTVYDSHDVSIQNVIIIDRLIRNDTPYGDFATAQHTEDPDYYLGRNEWLGNMSINSQDASMTFEADEVLTSGDLIWSIRNFVTVGSGKTGVNIGNLPYNYNEAGKPASIVENVSVLLSNVAQNISGVRVSSGQTTVNVKNSIAIGASRTGFNVLGSSVENSVAFNPDNSEGEFDTNNCIGECVALASDPLSDGSILYPLQVEDNSNVSMAIDEVAVGANITKRQGVDGAIFGDDNYNTLSEVQLWPWPNEARIKQEMCTDAGVIRGFCSTATQINSETTVTLTSYIWEFLGNQIPDSIYQ